jgi:hypothetical protein
MPFANDEFGENKQTATYTLFQASIKFSHTFYTFNSIRKNSVRESFWVTCFTKQRKTGLWRHYHHVSALPTKF